MGCEYGFMILLVIQVLIYGEFSAIIEDMNHLFLFFFVSYITILGNHVSITGELNLLTSEQISKRNMKKIEFFKY